MNALSFPSLADPDQAPRHVIITSIGDASPEMWGDLVESIDISREDFVRTAFQAPAVLIENVPAGTAQKLSLSLAEIGIDSMVSAHKPEEPNPLYEVTVRVRDERKNEGVFSHLATFIGETPADVARRLSQVPSVILSQVSASTITAFKNHMVGFDVDIVTSQKDGLGLS